MQHKEQLKKEYGHRHSNRVHVQDQVQKKAKNLSFISMRLQLIQQRYRMFPSVLYKLEHSPCIQDLTPDRSAAHAFEYVFLSQPHTGAYSNVQGPILIFDSSIQSFVLEVVPHELTLIKTILKESVVIIFFMGKAFRLKRFKSTFFCGI